MTRAIELIVEKADDPSDSLPPVRIVISKHANGQGFSARIVDPSRPGHRNSEFLTVTVKDGVKIWGTTEYAVEGLPFDKETRSVKFECPWDLQVKLARN